MSLCVLNEETYFNEELIRLMLNQIRIKLKTGCHIRETESLNKHPKCYFPACWGRVEEIIINRSGRTWVWKLTYLLLCPTAQPRRGIFREFFTIAELIRRPNPTRFFGFNPILGPIFGFKRVGLALRIQKRVQSGRVDLKKGSNSGSTL